MADPICMPYKAYLIKISAHYGNHTPWRSIYVYDLHVVTVLKVVSRLRFKDGQIITEPVPTQEGSLCEPSLTSEQTPLTR